MASDNKVYTAAPTLASFHMSSAPIRFIRGPIGSGKSVACVMEALRRAQETPYGADGVRRSRGVIVRNTLQQLKSTCLVTWNEWLRPISRFKVSDQTIQLRFTGPDRRPVECDIILLPLDTPENIQRLLSLELTFAWCSEVRELPLEIIQAVFSRCGRYPSRANVKDYWRGLWAETNSFSEDSEYFDFLELNKPKNVDYFVQPGGKDPDAENTENLPLNYYEDMMEANDTTPDWVDQYIHNKIGPSLSGQAVFARSFEHKMHVRDCLFVDYNRPIVIGLDTGRNPAAVVGQLDSRGRLLVFGSLHAENTGMELFITQHLKPYLSTSFYGGKFFVGIDPAAAQRSQIGEESVYDAVKRLGFNVVLAPTNQIAPRLRAVEKLFRTLIGDGGGLLIQEGTNKELLAAIMRDYKFKRDKKGSLAEIPEKGHPESDLADALQYLALCCSSSVIARQIAPPPRAMPPPPVGAWT